MHSPPGTHNATTITPPWPAPAYALACPQGTSQSVCNHLGPSALASGCFEPELDTAEVLSSLLYGCHAPNSTCLYVDVGCNIGAFALQAAALGARVECFEPAPFYVEAIRVSARLNGHPAARLNVTEAAVVTAGKRQVTMGGVHMPCGVGARAGAAHQRSLQGQPWNVHGTALRDILLRSAGQRVTLAPGTTRCPSALMTGAN